MLIDPILLHAYGIQRNLPKIVLFSTPNKAGLGIHHLYHIQGIAKLKLFLMHVRRNDTTGNLLKIAMDGTQFELGISTTFYEHKFLQIQTSHNTELGYKSLAIFK